MRWYVSRQGKTKGPFGKSDVIAAITAGQIGLDDTVCQEGTEEWLPVRELGAFASAAPTPLSAASEPARRTAGDKGDSERVVEPGFIATLFDFSFRKFLVVRIVRWLYVALLAFAALTFLIMVIYAVGGLISAQIELAVAGTGEEAMAPMMEAATSKRLAAILTLVAAPFVVALQIICGRIIAEMTVVIFSIAENLKRSS